MTDTDTDTITAPTPTTTHHTTTTPPTATATSTATATATPSPTPTQTPTEITAYDTIDAADLIGSQVGDPPTVWVSAQPAGWVARLHPDGWQLTHHGRIIHPDDGDGDGGKSDLYYPDLESVRNDVVVNHNIMADGLLPSAEAWGEWYAEHPAAKTAAQASDPALVAAIYRAADRAADSPD